MLDEKTVHVFQKKSSDGGALYLQAEGETKAKWYHLTEKTKPFSEKLKEGDKLNIDTIVKGDKTYVSFFKNLSGFSGGYKSNGGKSWPGKSSSSWGAKAGQSGAGSWGKDPATQDSIVKQTVLKGASELVSSLTFKTVEDALDAWDTAFEHMYNRVKTGGKVDDGGLVEVSTVSDDDEPIS